MALEKQARRDPDGRVDARHGRHRGHPPIMQADARPADRDAHDARRPRRHRPGHQAGAVGYLTKDCSIAEVVDAVRMAANGDTALSPKLAEVDARPRPARSTSGDEDGSITKREEEVLQLIADGCSTPEVAAASCTSARRR